MNPRISEQAKKDLLHLEIMLTDGASFDSVCMNYKNRWEEIEGIAPHRKVLLDSGIAIVEKPANNFYYY